MKNKTGFLLSIVLLIAGMTAGFLLLGTVYSGPAWVKFIVFILYLFVVCFTVRSSACFIKAAEEIEKERDQKK